ncbi:pentapeptide repeat-containing protein [Desmonostoc muscorum LEGE 12446]|nr:pentapeptide repeat-containing protein [Desmonostoc muscorum]MCF2149351.1 pentapeptide repeat-containing protein [Desmonostoc muscorum LEGE 12446]
MANQEHLEILRQGVQSWNDWREDNPEVIPDLEWADLSRVDLSWANLSGAKLKETKLIETNLNNANLSGADLSRADLIQTKLSGANLSGAKLISAYLSKLDLSNTNLQNATFSGFNLSEFNFSGVELSQAKFIKADLSGADLSGAKLGGAELIGANLEQANLSKANLKEAKLKGANLFKANLEKADLRNSDLSDAFMIGANLKDAKVEGATWNQVQLITKPPKINDIERCIYDEEKNDEEKKEASKNKLTKLSEVNGSKKLAEVIGKIEVELQKENNEILLNLSSEQLKALINLAFIVSMKREEARYPQFKIYVPQNNFQINNDNNALAMEFNEPIDLLENDFNNLHRMSSGIPPKPYALIIDTEQKDKLCAKGFIRIENIGFYSSSNQYTIRDHRLGLTLSIKNPGVLNVLHYPSPTWVTHLRLRDGKVYVNYDCILNPVANKIFIQILESLNKNGSEKNDSSENHSKNKYTNFQLIRDIWSYILRLAVEFGHGGTFIILPNDKIEKLSAIKHKIKNPNLGKLILDLENKKVNPSNEKQNQEQELQLLYQQIFDSARAIAQLSTVDGPVVLNRHLRLLGFGGETRVKDDSPNVEHIYIRLNPQSNSLEMDGEWESQQFGTRHNSAARVCASISGAAAFVVSQDGDIREFLNLNQLFDQSQGNQSQGEKKEIKQLCKQIKDKFGNNVDLSKKKICGVCGPLSPLWLPPFPDFVIRSEKSSMSGHD